MLRAYLNEMLLNVCVCVGSATKTEHSRDIRRALVVFHSALFVVVVVVVVAVCICIRVYL